MRPLLLKGHERSITCLRYNQEGDLLFTASKGLNASVWFTENGERLGTYNGHTGAIWSLDVDRHTQHLLTASADLKVNMWNVETGRMAEVWTHTNPIRCVAFALGDKQFLSATDQVMHAVASVKVFDVLSSNRKHVIDFHGKEDHGKILSALWGPLNQTILTAHEDGNIRIYDIRSTVKELHTIRQHSKAVTCLQYHKSGAFFVSASRDGTSHLFDAKSFERLKTYTTGRPINGAALSPIKDEVLLGGGQSAADVTTTRVDNSQFRSRFFHMIFEEEIGSVPGPFGPLNAVNYHPSGEGFAVGGEDGYIRLHWFDKNYFASDTDE